jgi:carbamoyltransferase
MPRKPSTILGLSFSHGDSSAALIIDGCLVAAAEEERFTRVKHYALFPTKAVEYCLAHAKISPQQIQVVAIAKRPWNALKEKIGLMLHHPEILSHKQQQEKHVQKESLSALLKQAGLTSARMVRVEHHLAHMFSARFLAEDDNLAFLSFDGMGDFVSTAVGRIADHRLQIMARVHFPHSLGYFYTALTQYLGFPHFGDEFKVMGLSSYGQPRYLSALRELIREAEPFGFTLNLEAFPILERPMHFYIDKMQPKVDPFYSSNFLTQVIGLPSRKAMEPLTRDHWDLAKSVQARFEEIANHLLRQLHERAGQTSVVLSGGCAHNSVWVGKIPQNSPYEKVFVAPASNDAGIAIGAAIFASDVHVTPEGKHWALLGPSPEEITEPSPAPAFPFPVQERSFKNDDDLIHWMVEQLAQEKIIGLCRDRMEFGPRALGNRSILADPRCKIMKDRLNKRVKHRESFRPFAASVLWDFQSQWFIDGFFSPSMEAVFDVKENVRSKVPAIVHVDNSCRVQSVKEDTQPFFWKLIDAFRRKTGVPMLLNTSFNDTEPVVCTAEDAVKCFIHTDLDVLVIGRKVFLRDRAAVALTA